MKPTNQWQYQRTMPSICAGEGDEGGGVLTGVLRDSQQIELLISTARALVRVGRLDDALHLCNRTLDLFAKCVVDHFLATFDTTSSWWDHMCFVELAAVAHLLHVRFQTFPGVQRKHDKH